MAPRQRIHAAKPPWRRLLRACGVITTISVGVTFGLCELSRVGGAAPGTVRRGHAATDRQDSGTLSARGAPGSLARAGSEPADPDRASSQAAAPVSPAGGGDELKPSAATTPPRGPDHPPSGPNPTPVTISPAHPAAATAPGRADRVTATGAAVSAADAPSRPGDPPVTATPPSGPAPTVNPPAPDTGGDSSSSAPAASNGAPAGASPGSPGVPAPQPGTVTVIRLAGPGQSSATHDVYVYRPAVADSASLPVVYWLHGVPGRPGDPFGAGWAAALDQAFARGAAPFAAVAPDGNGDHHDDTEWADAWDGSDRVESFLRDIVIPAVESPYPRDGRHRAVVGNSMGGYGALNLAMRNPGLFSQVTSIAGYFHVNDPDSMFGGQNQLIVDNSPDQHVEAAAGLHILLLDGDGESDPVIRGESERMGALLNNAGIPATVRLSPGDDTWDYVSAQFGVVIDFLEAGFASP